MNINYRSDYRIVETAPAGRSISEVPFRMTYYVNPRGVMHLAEYDGSKYVGCAKEGDGISVHMDGVMLGIGRVHVNREFFVPDTSYPDGVCHIVSIESTCVELTKGATEGVVVYHTIHLPFEKVSTPTDKARVDGAVLYLSAIVGNSTLMLNTGSVNNAILTI